MDFCGKVWQIMFVCLLCRKAGCSMQVICSGVLQVEPGNVVPMGTSLTILCRSYSEHCGRNFSIYLNRQLQGPLQVLNCSTVRLRLDITVPDARLLCRVSRGRLQQTVCGTVLLSGYPPEKPTGLRCFAPWDSENVSCTWNKGRDTHLPTEYFAAFQFKNGTQAFHQQSYNGSSVCAPWSLFDVDVEFSVKAQNGLGEAVSDVIPMTVRDVVIPSTPKIIMVQFGNGSLTGTLHWSISESSRLWRAKVRITDHRRHTEFWGTELRQGVVLLDDLRPLSRYEFQIQACSSGEKPKCSHWSPPLSYTSPGTVPTKKLDAWRILRGTQANGRRSVTVLWKPLRAEDCRDVMVAHKLVYQERGQTQVVTCQANVTEKTLHVSPDVRTIYIYAVTSTGESPPATLHISETDGLTMPRVRGVAPADKGGVLLTWDVYHHENVSPLAYVVQWQRSHSQEIYWKRLAADDSFTHIKGLEPGVRFNISLFAITTMGISDPASLQAYSSEEKPLSGPKVSLLNTEANRMLIQWEELSLDQQRGFITNYTVYMRKRNTGQQLTLAGSMSRQMWLKHLDTPFDLHISASNSAGEGPVGEGVFCRLRGSPKAWPSVGLGLVIAVPLVILANLMCWDCARRSITRTCTMVGPQWLFENFPKVENSTATKLLQHTGRSDSESSWKDVYVDPPITPVEIVPAERSAWQPSAVGIKSADVGLGGRVSPGEPESGPLLEEEHAYKPQITPAAQEELAEEEDNPWMSPVHTGVSLISGDGDTLGSLQLSGLLRDWLSDRSGAGLNTTGGIHFKSTPQIVLTTGSWLEDGLAESLHLGQTLLPDQLVSCLRSPATEPSSATFLGELPSMPHNITTEECV